MNLKFFLFFLTATWKALLWGKGCAKKGREYRHDRCGAQRYSSNNSGARSSIVASVPRYSRLTDPPGKKTLSLRDAMPPDLSEHFCVGPCCTALQPSGAQQVRATSVWVL